MIFYRRYSDYLRLYWRVYHRLIIAIFFFFVGLIILVNNLLSGIYDLKHVLIAFVSLCSMSVSGYFIYGDLKKWRNERFDLHIIEDETFNRSASLLRANEGTLESINDYFVWSDRSINPLLDLSKTWLKIKEPRYEVPSPLKNFIAKAVDKRRPTWDETK